MPEMRLDSLELLIALEDHLLKTNKKLEKACPQRVMVWGDFKDLSKRKASNNLLRDKLFNIAKNYKPDKY